MDSGDLTYFQDGFYITDGTMISESDMIEGAQSLDNLSYDSSNYQLIYGVI
jgi:hypothetical protein